MQVLNYTYFNIDIYEISINTFLLYTLNFRFSIIFNLLNNNNNNKQIVQQLLVLDRQYKSYNL